MFTFYYAAQFSTCKRLQKNSLHCVAIFHCAESTDVLVLPFRYKIFTKRADHYGFSGMDCPGLYFGSANGFAVSAIQQVKARMEKQLINNQRRLFTELFTPAELDCIIYALFKYVAELRSRTHLMERFASREHLQNHCAKILLAEKLLNDFR